MELKQIRYFLELARLEHVAQAADELGISQPTLSKSLGSLEKELGIQLFDRIGNRIRLNRSGEQFQKHAAAAIRQLDTGTLSAKQSIYETSGSIQIACLTFAPILLGALQDYMMLNPNISVNVIQYNHRKYRDDFDTEYDFLLSAVYGPESDTSTADQFWIPRTLFSETNVLVVGPKHPLYDSVSESEAIDLKRFEDSNFITMRLDNRFNEITYQICRQAGFFPRSTFQTDDFAAKMVAVREGIGAAFLPEACLTEAAYLCPRLKHAYVKDSTDRRRIVLRRRKSGLLSEAALDFWNYILDYYGLPSDEET